MVLKKRINLKYNVTGYIFLVPAMVMFLVFVFIPAIQTVFTSLTEWDGISPKRFIGLQNYINLFLHDGLYWKAMANSLAWAAATAVIPVWIGLILANLLVRGNVKYAKGLQLIFFLPQVISTVIAAVIWKWIYDPAFGPLNSFLKLIGLEKITSGWLGDPDLVMVALFVIYVWQTYGFCLVVFSSAIQGVDVALYDASEIDGCSKWGQFWNVTMPGIRHAMTFVVLLMTAWSFQVFDLIMATTQGGPGYSSYVISYYVYYSAFVVAIT